MKLSEAFELPDGTKVRAKPSADSPYWYGTVVTSHYYGKGVQFEDIRVEVHDKVNSDSCQNFNDMADVLLDSLEVVEGG